MTRSIMLHSSPPCTSLLDAHRRQYRKTMKKGRDRHEVDHEQDSRSNWIYGVDVLDDAIAPSCRFVFCSTFRLHAAVLPQWHNPTFLCLFIAEPPFDATLRRHHSGRRQLAYKV
jgi:hypothetical protein